ncbi:hypothetical protein V6Z11_D06G012700 [Gossypium hirsutum]
MYNGTRSVQQTQLIRRKNTKRPTTHSIVAIHGTSRERQRSLRGTMSTTYSTGTHLPIMRILYGYKIYHKTPYSSYSIISTFLPCRYFTTIDYDRIHYKS